MTDDRPLIDTIAESIRHTLEIHPWGPDLPYPFSEYVNRMKAETATELVAALRAAGYEIVKLPEPEGSSDCGGDGAEAYVRRHHIVGDKHRAVVEPVFETPFEGLVC